MVTFVDTNVLVYAHDASETVKQPRARAVLERLWADGDGVLSTQVLQEFYVVATRPHNLAMTPAEARDVVDAYCAWPVVRIEPTMILSATRLHETVAVSFWDALIVEAARVGGAERILTEDLADGQLFDGIRIEDPFREHAAGI